MSVEEFYSSANDRSGIRLAGGADSDNVFLGKIYAYFKVVHQECLQNSVIIHDEGITTDTALT